MNPIFAINIINFHYEPYNGNRYPLPQRGILIFLAYHVNIFSLPEYFIDAFSKSNKKSEQKSFL